MPAAAPVAPNLKALIQAQITPVITGFGSAQYTGPTNPVQAQQKFIDELSTALANAVSIYIQTAVTTPLQLKVILPVP